MASEKENTARPGRWLRILLFLSLALNLLVVGAAVGFFLNGPPAPRGDRSDPVLPYTRAFDEDQRRELRRGLWRAMRKDAGAMRAGYLADYQRGLDLLRQDPFDQAALAALLADQAARGVEVRARGQEVLLNFLAEMSPEERRAYADRLESELERMRSRGNRRDGDKDGRQSPKPPRD
ncbi:periplasmic heavy metal sensor [Mameliella sp.]|uniref:periplasmic heavy metal sensor n=1 Tax=Mameliella sp. TaxID=1924940 RepID=UPI003BA8E3E0